ncbi:hypothetical protein N7475_009423 [Penicillium sp. IBT 31633x]|nr:hypothetical protein N7475_009423 [Penicillium sp. IBT 31633x]
MPALQPINHDNVRPYHSWARLAELCGGPVDDLQITPPACVRCNIGLSGTPGPWPLIVINHWINENHLIWSLCAGLAETGLNTAWTRSFNDLHREQWVRIQENVSRTEGAARCLLNIPAPPILLAVFTHQTGPNAPRTNNIIMATPASTRPDGGLLKLLRFVYHGGIDLADHFVVILYEQDLTGFAVPESPRPSGRGWLLEQSFEPQPRRPALPPYREVPDEDHDAPPPPYRESSPPPPGYAP